MHYHSACCVLRTENTAIWGFNQRTCASELGHMVTTLKRPLMLTEDAHEATLTHCKCNTLDKQQYSSSLMSNEIAPSTFQSLQLLFGSAKLC